MTDSEVQVQKDLTPTEKTPDLAIMVGSGAFVVSLMAFLYAYIQIKKIKKLIRTLLTGR